MASIDQLQIEIQASSQDAKNAIDSLVKSLKDLNKQLGLKDGTAFAKTLGSMARAMDSFTGKMNNFNASKFGEAAKGAESAYTSLNRATEQAEKYREALSKISKSDIASVQKRLLERDLAKKTGVDALSVKQEAPLALPMFEKMLPAVVNTDSAINQMFRDMINQSAAAKTAVDPLVARLMEMKELVKSPFTFADPYTDKQGNYHSADVTAWQAVMDKTSGSDYFYQTAEAANAAGDSIKNVNTTALATVDSFKQVEEYAKKAYESTAESVEGFKSWDLGTGLEEPLERLSQNAKHVKSNIERATEAARTFKETISSMESGKTLFDKDMYDQAIKGYEKATETIKNYKNELLGNKEKSTDAGPNVLTNIVELSDALEKVSERFNMVAEKGISLFKFLTTPMRKVVDEYKEKFGGMIDSVVNFRKNFQAHMKKVSDFWKRTMRTFTFMLVRKAITAIIKEVNNAIQSMAMFSNAMGTEFNNSISLLVADFQYLGRSIVSVFAPLLNYIAPIIDAIVDKIALLLSYIGMLMAALTGASSFTKAKKNVGNYAKSLDSASKSAKNLTMGIDELNILSENSGGGGAKPYDGWEDAWEEVEIPDWIKDLANKIKGMFADLLEPIKKAWEQVKEYFKFAFQYMTDQIVQLAQSIWDAFITVWKQDKTVELFKTLFRIVADLMIVIGNLAKKFREAWDEADRGVRIFEGIRDILLILADHVRNVTWYMVRWSSELDFSNLLDGVINLLDGFKKLADFIGGVFEDVMKNVVLKYIKFLIEDGIPHLLNKIDEVIGKFDFEKIRKDLVPIEEAFERLLENLDLGKTNAFGNLGEQIAAFTNSEEFSNFTQRIADIMDLISAEDVEKILTGIGQGILDIAESLVKFVNSDGFMSFLEFIDKWVEDATSEDIAGVIKTLATAIGLFKFGAFATEKLAGFFKFASVIVALKNLHEIATGFTVVGEGGAAAASGLTSAASAAAVVVVVITLVVGAVYSLIKSFGGLGGLLEEIKRRFNEVKMVVENVAKAIDLGGSIENLKNQFKRLTDKLGDMKDAWDVILDVIEFFAAAITLVLEPAIKFVIDLISGFIDMMATAVDVTGGLATVLKSVGDGITTGDWDSAWEGMKSGAGRVKDAIIEGITGIDPNEIGEKTAEKVTQGVNQVPDAVIPSIESSTKKIADSTAQSYKNATQPITDAVKENNTESIAEGIANTDYVGATANFGKLNLDALTGTIDNQDYSSVGWLFGDKTAEAILNGSQPFTDANITTAEEGASTFNSSYMDYFSGNSQIADELGTIGETSGLALANGFNSSIATGQSETNATLLSWFGSIKGTINRQMDQLKAMFSNMFANVFSVNGIDVITPINDIFTTVTNTVTNNINTLGNNLKSTLLPAFIQTHILPFFNTEMWQPLFDNLLNVVFIPQFELFQIWFDESMLVWWEEHMLTWFTAERWDEDIFTPLAENIHEHFETFSSWWDATMLAWWTNQVEPWFEQEKWTGLFNHILDAVKEVFKKIVEEIRERIQEAVEVVVEACETMADSLQTVLDLIDEIMTSLKEGFGDFSGTVSFDFGGSFASGGFPSYGSLFVAGEPGAGAELVGNIHGRTGVVSNGEITGIEDAVYATGNAETELLSQLITITRAMLDKDPVVITDKDIARLNNSGQGKLGMSIIS